MFLGEQSYNLPIHGLGRVLLDFYQRKTLASSDKNDLNYMFLREQSYNLPIFLITWIRN